MIHTDDPRDAVRRRYFRNSVRRCATTYSELPTLWVWEAERAIELWHGGFWWALAARIRWHFRFKWVCDWCPVAVGRRLWFRWHEFRGHVRDSGQRRHWYTCCLPDDYGVDSDDEADVDDCIEDEMPRWLRIA